MKERIRELTFEERARWGECPVCWAKDGEPCSDTSGVGIMSYVSGTSRDTKAPQVHLGRLQYAPRRIKEVAL